MADKEINADADFQEGLKRILYQSGGFPLWIKGAGPDIVMIEAETFTELVRDATRFRDMVSPEVESGPAMNDKDIRDKMLRDGDE